MMLSSFTKLTTFLLLAMMVVVHAADEQQLMDATTNLRGPRDLLLDDRDGHYGKYKCKSDKRPFAGCTDSGMQQHCLYKLVCNNKGKNCDWERAGPGKMWRVYKSQCKDNEYTKDDKTYICCKRADGTV